MLQQEKEEKKKQMLDLYDKYMVFAGILGQYLFYAQAYKVFTTKSAGDLSLDGFLVVIIATLSWLVYGILHKQPPIIIAQIVALIGMTLVIIGIFLYS
ncbi:SemiSWEET family sugar transporter [Candidatus Tisiphia endosymbiont of Nemotelus uliginosus]|uniref:SemiSWEET family sugar transporter n=1 Tax=Candidatus Tisiphia endosymbiont of Nemotelus uliginosus TaxID=3077926 RepID=UPI0035C8B784